MIRLGLSLVLRSGREARARFLAMVVVMAVGVTILLALAAEDHGFESAARTPSWSSTQTTAADENNRTGNLLWNDSRTVYRGRIIQQLLVAPLGAHPPHITGVSAIPGPGQYLASPALVRLLRTAPADQLADRFPGHLSGLLGAKALTGPQSLDIVIGYRATQLAMVPGTVTVGAESTAPGIGGGTTAYRLAFGAAAIALLFPLLILIGTGARLSTARREQRYAAIRLVGGTTRQVGMLAAVEAGVSAVAGAVLGCGSFVALRPAIARLSVSGESFFPGTVTPSRRDYVALLVAMPCVAMVTSLLALRRVSTSPLGVARRVPPPPPRWPRLLPLLTGAGLVLAILLPARPSTGPNASAAPTFSLPGVLVGLLLIMIGLVSAGPWMTAHAGRALIRLLPGPSGLLAGRRMADRPATAYRAIAGLVLAVFVGTTIAVVGATVNAGQTRSPADRQLADVLQLQFPVEASGPLPAPPAGGKNPAAVDDGLSPSRTAGLLAHVRAFPGVSVLPMFALPGSSDAGPTTTYNSVVSCSSLTALPALGTCPAGAHEVELDPLPLTSDNPLYVNKVLPLVRADSPTTTVDPTGLALDALLIQVPDAATLERVRTYLTTSTPVAATGQPPQTFGETAAIRARDITDVERGVLVAVLLTLVVASCSLAVTVGGGLLERQRPFTLLRLSGTPLTALSRVVLLESGVPLLLGGLLAAGVALATAAPFTHAILPSTVHVASPSTLFYVVLGCGLLSALAVVLAALPLLARVTNPAQARFE